MALDAAAAHARARGAALAAAELAERAVALTPVAAAADICRRRITAAGLCADAGDVAKARAMLEVAVASSPPGPIRAEALCRLADVRSAVDGNPVAMELLSSALAEPGVGSRQRAAILSSRASMASVGGDIANAARDSEAGLRLAEELGEPETLVRCLTLFADTTFWQTGRIRRDLFDRAIDLHRRIDGGLSSDPRPALAHQLARAERFDESRAIWDELIAEGVDRDYPNLSGFLFFLARMEVGSGRWDRAAQLCDDAMQLARQTGHEVIEPLCRMILAEIDLTEARPTPRRRPLPAAARRRAPRVRGRNPSPQPRSCVALARPPRSGCRLASGRAVVRRDRGDGRGRRPAGRLGRNRGADWERRPAPGRATAHAARRPFDRRRHRSPLLSHRCRGLLLASQGDHENAIVELEAAAVVPDPPQGVNPFELARTFHALGRVKRQAQHKRAARESLQRSLEIFERLGARPWADATRSELRRIGGRIASGGQLSETERRIVELVVAGRRNREVADELSLSPNTVAWNLSKIYRKLGVTSRTELAAQVAASPLA